LVGVFGLFHGHAHGTELPPGENGLYYSLGFVMATGTLHGCGIAIGEIHRWAAGKTILRLCGVLIALAGAYFLWEALHPEAAELAATPTRAEAVTPRE
jgi:urease accessory protein